MKRCLSAKKYYFIKFLNFSVESKPGSRPISAISINIEGFTISVSDANKDNKNSPKLILKEQITKIRSQFNLGPGIYDKPSFGDDSPKVILKIINIFDSILLVKVKTKKNINWDQVLGIMMLMHILNLREKIVQNGSNNVFL